VASNFFIALERATLAHYLLPRRSVLPKAPIDRRSGTKNLAPASRPLPAAALNEMVQESEQRRQKHAAR